MKARNPKLPPTCPACGTSGSPFATAIQEVEQHFRRDTLKFEAPVTACQQCGFALVTDEQANELLRLTHEAYRKKHNLLTAEEIIAGRKRLGMTQAQFAKHVGAGIASVKRWETGYVQDPNCDLRLREKIGGQGLLWEQFLAFCRQNEHLGFGQTALRADLLRSILRQRAFETLLDYRFSADRGQDCFRAVCALWVASAYGSSPNAEGWLQLLSRQPSHDAGQLHRRQKWTIQIPLYGRHHVAMDHEPTDILSVSD